MSNISTLKMRGREFMNIGSKYLYYKPRNNPCGHGLYSEKYREETPIECPECGLFYGDWNGLKCWEAEFSRYETFEKVE